jgi:DNA-binding MurR/RpiR family transcriptional regulator
MRKRQGERLPEKQIATIQRLLSDTDMTINEIAERVDRSKTAILRINEKFGIRKYAGRSHWRVNDWKSSIRESA